MKEKTYNVFAFGSLRDPNFVKKLLDKSVEMNPARLQNFRKIKIPKFEYPLVIKSKDNSIKGKLLLKISEEDLKRIDQWEKTPQRYYKKTRVKVITREGIKEAIAYTTEKKSLKGHFDC